MYPFKILNKTKYSLYFLNAFIENICIYIMPIIISICLTTPFTLNKFKILIILTITLKTLEIIFNSIWNIKAVYFLEETKKDLQLAYFRRICDMNVTKINNTHTGFLKKQIDIVKPKIILTLGYYPIYSLSMIYDFKICSTLTETIETYGKIILDNFVIIPLYHPASQIKKEIQLNQYMKIWDCFKK